MLSLLIETCTERSLIALFRDLDPLDIRELPFGLQNSKHLLPEIQALFERAGLKPADLDLIVAGIGPGSYTGIRVGAMTAKAMAFALNIPVIGISTLEGFTAIGSYAAVIDAKIGGIYVGLPGSDPALYSLDQAKELLKNVETLVTPNSAVLKSKLPHPKWLERYPDPIPMMRHRCLNIAPETIPLKGASICSICAKPRPKSKKAFSTYRKGFEKRSRCDLNTPSEALERLLFPFSQPRLFLLFVERQAQARDSISGFSPF